MNRIELFYLNGITFFYLDGIKAFYSNGMPCHSQRYAVLLPNCKIEVLRKQKNLTDLISQHVHITSLHPVAGLMNYAARRVRAPAKIFCFSLKLEPYMVQFQHNAWETNLCQCF